MIRIAFGLAVLLLAAFEPAPEIEVVVRLEEFGSSYEYPALLGACPEGLHVPDEELIHRIEINAVVDRAFQIKAHQPPITREFSGKISLRDDGRMLLSCAYAVRQQLPEINGIKRQAASTAQATVPGVIGKPVVLGGMVSTTFTDKIRSGRRISFRTTILKPTSIVTDAQ